MTTHLDYSLELMYSRFNIGHRLLGERMSDGTNAERLSLLQATNSTGCQFLPLLRRAVCGAHAGVLHELPSGQRGRPAQPLSHLRRNPDRPARREPVRRRVAARRGGGQPDRKPAAAPGGPIRPGRAGSRNQSPNRAQKRRPAGVPFVRVDRGGCAAAPGGAPAAVPRPARPPAHAWFSGQPHACR